jgi:hypothetical protein
MEGADREQPGFDAYAVWDCSPGDSPHALTVYVAEDAVFTFFPPEVPHFRIEVFRAGSELAHHTFQWPADEGFAKLQWCPGYCGPVAAGRVTFGEVQPNRFVEGVIEVGTHDSIKVQRRFKANWGPRLKGCG